MSSISIGSDLLECVEHGTDAQKGNLLGIQPFMEVPDYSTEEAFFTKLDQYFAESNRRGWIGPKTIAILPEYVAAWLLVAGEGPGVIQSRITEVAMIRLILANLGAFLKYFFKAPARDRVKYAIFRMKAEQVGRIYHSVFSRLAKKYGVTVVAGSVVLPALEVRGSELVFKGDKLFNTTLVYKPNGEAYPETVHKVYVTPPEIVYTECGRVDALPVFTTPAGRLGVLNCADSWYADTYKKLEGKIDFLAVPSFIEKNFVTGAPWKADNIAPLPVEYDPKDQHRITYDDAWIKYAMPSRIHTAGVQHGVNVFLRGKFWSLGSDGHSILMHSGKLLRGKDGSGAALQNLWLT